jgi:hypothetical protein
MSRDSANIRLCPPLTAEFCVALRYAFDATRRQLEDYVRRRRGQVKAHEERPMVT